MQALTTELSAFTGVVSKELRGCCSGDLRRGFHRHNLKKIWATCIERLCCFARKHFSDAEMSLKIFHDHGIEERVACTLKYVVNIEKLFCTSTSSILPCVNCLLIGRTSRLSIGYTFPACGCGHFFPKYHQSRAVLKNTH